MMLLVMQKIVTWKVINLYLIILIVFSVVVVTWTFDLFGNFKMKEQGIHCVPKGLKLRIDQFECCLMSKKQVGLGSNLGYGFVHGYLMIRVLYGFACFWKVVAD